MHDPGVRRHHLEAPKRLLSPFEKGVALCVPGELQLGIQVEGGRTSEVIDLNGMIDHQFRRLDRIDRIRSTPELLDPVAHRGQVDNRWHTCEILQQHAGRHESDLLAGSRRPTRQHLDVIGRHRLAVFAPQHVL